MPINETNENDNWTELEGEPRCICLDHLLLFDYIYCGHDINFWRFDLKT